MEITILILMYVVILFFQWIPVIKSKKKKELVAYSFLMLSAAFIFILKLVFKTQYSLSGQISSVVFNLFGVK